MQVNKQIIIGIVLVFSSIPVTKILQGVVTRLIQQTALLQFSNSITPVFFLSVLPHVPFIVFCLIELVALYIIINAVIKESKKDENT